MISPSEFALAKLYDLEGLVALVTGGGTGIGLMIAQGLAANGARVYITGRRVDVLQGVADEWGKKKESRMGKIIGAGQGGPLSPELNKPSPTSPKNAEELGKYLFAQESFEQWSNLYAINTFSVYFVTVGFLALLEKGSKDIPGFTSSVINITSISGLIKVAQRHVGSFPPRYLRMQLIPALMAFISELQFCYNSSKAAASHLTKMLATEFALKQIPVRVNAIAPGVYESELTYDVIEGQVATDAVGMPVISVPAKRPGTAAEMAGTAVYLASPAAGYMNGQEIVIDGGYGSVTMAPTVFDCIVVGSGHAGASAALAAAEAGCTDVLVVEKASEEWAGGNGYFTAGAMRAVHGGLQDLLPIIRNVIPEQAEKIDVEQYTTDNFIGDIMRLGNNKPDAVLVETMVRHSRDAIEWLSRKVGVPFILSFHRQAYEINGRQKFWGGIALCVEDGGKGLIKAELEALRKSGVQIWFDAPALRLLSEDGAVVGVVVRRNGHELSLTAQSVILAAGGFEADAELRRKHLGDGWERARVRGTPFNTGDGIKMAQAVGAKLVGDWSGCHSTCWDANALEDRGDRNLSNQFTKSGYPLGIMVNINGERFVDEGQDFRNYTYAKFGRAILSQPEGVAFQVWDTEMIPLLRKEEYGDGIVEKIAGFTVEELADGMMERGLRNKDGFLSTVKEYNSAVYLHRLENPSLRCNPGIKDNLSTQSSSASLSIPKSNWAVPIVKGPFLAVKVACGITFTFGGVAIDPDTAAVLSDSEDRPISGLFCAGEMVGNLYYNNYPGGSGLTAGTVFGRKAGVAAARKVGKLVHSR
ncbi:hypothetical protein ID866_1772 [Astraeus odoratus]|nr:hypothetical protein ID866_1772 [Astraeus odoratus]